MEKPKKQIQKPIWQKVEDAPDVALGWNEVDLVMRGEENIFEKKSVVLVTWKRKGESF